MPRGGYRKNAGGKPTWKHGKTKVIRVPEALADEVLRYARSIDDVTETNLNQSKTINLTRVPVYSSNKGSLVYLSDLIAFGYEIFPVALHRLATQHKRFEQQKRVKQLKDEISYLIDDINLGNE